MKKNYNCLKNKSLTILILLLSLLAFSTTACKKGEGGENAPTPNAAEETKPEGEAAPTPSDNPPPQEEEHDMAKNPKLSVGDQAPAWSLASDNAGEISSDSLKGEKYILYFYPKDNTSGCTTEAIDFQEKSKDFADKGYKIFGISSDSIDSHKEFRGDHNLEFTLLSDPDHKVAEEYGVYREKNSYGKVALGTVRSTFVIDETGKITQIHDNVKATGHVDRLLAGL